jgi:hypothetical protein
MATTTIADAQTLSTEIVLQPQVVSNNYMVVEIHESIKDRFVRAEVEMGPFVTETRPDGSTQVRSTGGRRGINVWSNESYDAIRDTWTNRDLLANVAILISNS